MSKFDRQKEARARLEKAAGRQTAENGWREGRGTRVGERVPAVLLAVFLAMTAAGCGRTADSVMSLAAENVSAEESAQDAAERVSAEESAQEEAERVSAGESAQNASESVSADEAAADETGENAGMAVYICGAVVSPGVYEVAENMRLVDAVALAGGFLENADESFWNLAQKLEDGSMYYIPTIAETAEEDFSLPGGSGESAQSGTDAAGGDTSGKSSSGESDASSGETAQEADGLICINTATKEELMTLPGIGETKASAIITYRETNGAFTSVEEITNVSGIGESTYEKLKEYICV